MAAGKVIEGMLRYPNDVIANKRSTLARSIFRML